MCPLIPLFQQKVVQEVCYERLNFEYFFLNFAMNLSFYFLQIFEHILYIWAIRHPASGYVQGINDLVTPFFVVFLSEFISDG